MPPKKAAKVFAGETFCVSGSFSISQGEMKELCSENGAEIAATPNKSCTYLVADGMGSAKTMKAAKDGINIVTEDFVHDSIKAGKMKTDKKYFLSGGASGAKNGSVAPADDDDDEEDAKPAKKAAPKKATAAASNGGDVFAGEYICVSGSFSISQTEMKTLCIRNGADIVDTPNKKCTFVISDQIGSAKTAKAVKDGIDVCTEQWVHDSIKAGKKLTDKKYFLSGGDSAPMDDDEDEEEETKKKPAAKKTAGTKRKKASADDDDDEDDKDADDDEDEAPKKAQKKSATSGPSSAAASSGSGSSSSGSDVVRMKKVVVKGTAPVDDLCPVHSTTHVYSPSDKDVYDCMLNQTNIGNNNNKFYVIQLLESDSSPKNYWVWNRWGRVGVAGQNSLQPCGASLDMAKSLFEKKYNDKTKNHWSNRANFTTYPGKYTLLERSYANDDDDDAAGAGNANKTYPDSKLDDRVQELVKLICDVKMMKDAMLEVGYDANKLPLGNLSKDHIRKGYLVLQEISNAINNDQLSQCKELSNQFYTLIPHVVGMRPPPIINNAKLLKEKIAMVESLADVSVATNLLRQPSTGAESDINPVDHHYEKLKCEFTPVDKKSSEFKMITDYTANTHGHTHSHYSLEVLEAFSVDREGEAERFSQAGFDGTPNTQLLWHGSRLTNFVGIISQGLRIAPPEAPVTGYMFGKGVYFADMVSKSANYTNTNRSNNIGCMLLCEVALGETNDLLQANYHADKLPAGKLSTKGVGQNFPDPTQQMVLPSGVIVPLGKEKQTRIPGSALLYNEFIVYNVAQIKCKYLVKMKFNYK